MIAPEAGLSVSRQCALLGIARSSFYYRPSRNCPNDRDHLHTGPLGTLRRTPLHPRMKAAGGDTQHSAHRGDR